MAREETDWAAKAISEAEYELWLPPPAALKKIESLLRESPAMDEIYRRLCGGQVRSAARTANWYDQNGFPTVRKFGLLHEFLWQTTKPKDYDLFWKTGTHNLSRRLFASSTKHYPIECFGIRFDPEGIAGILRDGGADMLETAPNEFVNDKRPLSRAAAEKFAKAILASWPQASQDWAHEKALLFFPDQIISRAEFRRIFRAIQGPKKPGKTTKKL